MVSPLGRHYIRSVDAVATPVGDRVVLYHRVSRAAVVLNPTAAWLWSRLDQPRAMSALASELCARYPSLSVEDATRDITTVFADLAQHALVSVDA